MIDLSIKKAKTLEERMRGLIGKEEPQTLMIETHFGIHTFGLKFSIDVIILNNKNKVVSIKKNLKPNRIFFWNPIYKNVIELPEGTIEKNAIRINDAVNLKIITH
jgi:uncharacterized protein